MSTTTYLFGDLLEPVFDIKAGTKVRIVASRDGLYLLMKGKSRLFQANKNQVGNLRREVL